MRVGDLLPVKIEFYPLIKRREGQKDFLPCVTKRLTHDGWELSDLRGDDDDVDSCIT